MNIIKTSSIHFTKKLSKETIASLSETFENYLSKNYKIIAKFPHLGEAASKRKNFQILYYLQHK